MMYVWIPVVLLMLLLNFMFKIASLFRLSIPLLYALVVPILFPDWVAENNTLVTVIFIGLIALVILSWVITIRKRILRKRQQKEYSNMNNQ